MRTTASTHLLPPPQEDILDKLYAEAGLKREYDAGASSMVSETLDTFARFAEVRPFVRLAVNL